MPQFKPSSDHVARNSTLSNVCASAKEGQERVANIQRYRCVICSGSLGVASSGKPSFESATQLHRHYQRAHGDRYCVPCERIFTSASNLGSHRRSYLHQGAGFQCPLRDCEKCCVSLAALFLHLEAGTCTSGTAFNKVVKAAKLVDNKHIITVPSVDKTPTTNDGQRAGGYGPPYSCPRCPKKLSSPSALGQHLRSAAHADRVFRCPPSYGCDARFRTLSGLCQHVESEQCRVHQYRAKVDKVLKSILKKMMGTAEK